MTRRLFIALHPPEPVRAVLLSAMEGLEGARWQGEDNLHLTLRFVGEVETAQANDLAAELALIVMAPFALEIRGVGHFEDKGHPHAIWANVAGSPELLSLHAHIEQACRNAGLEPEARDYVPHVTLAWLNRSSAPIGSWMAINEGLAAGPWQADSFVLYESHLVPGGSDYMPVARFPL